MTTILGKKLRNFGLTNPVRSRKFLAFVRNQNCLFCNGDAEPHHFLGSVHGLKSSDVFTVPLCREHHEYFEKHGGDNDELIYHSMRMMHEYIRHLTSVEKEIENEAMGL